MKKKKKQTTYHRKVIKVKKVTKKMGLEEILEASLEKWRQIEDIIHSNPVLPCPLCVALDDGVIDKCPLDKFCNTEFVVLKCCSEWGEANDAIRKMKYRLCTELKKIENKGEK